MADRTLTLLPDGDPDYLGGGPTADTSAANTSGTLAVLSGNGMQLDVLHCGKTFVKALTGVKQTVFARFRADVFGSNMYPNGVRFKFTSAQAGTPSMQFRVGILLLPFRPAYKTPPDVNAGGFHSGNYSLQRDMPHVSGVATSTSNSDTITPSSVFGTPLTLTAPATPAGTVWSTGFGTATPYDLANNIFFPIGIAQSANLGESVFGIAIDSVGLPVGLGTPEAGIYFHSVHAQDVAKPPIELRVDWSDHVPAITSSDPSSEIPIAPFTFTFTASTDSAPIKPGSAAWSILTTPAGVTNATLDATTGVFDWQPTGAGSFTWSIQYSITSAAVMLYQVTEQIYAAPTVSFTLTVTPAEIVADTGLEIAVAAESGLDLAVDGTAGIEDQVVAETGLELAVEGDGALEFALNAEVGLQ